MEKPFVRIVSGVTVDGKITLNRGVSAKDTLIIESDNVKRFLHEIRAKSDAILVGGETVRTDNPLLTVRYTTGKNPVRIIITKSLNLPEEANIFNKEAPTIIVTTQSSSLEKREFLRSLGVEVLVTRESHPDLKALLQKLTERNIKSLMVEGGSLINYFFIKDRLFDELILIQHPILFAGDSVPTLVGGEPLKDLNEACKLKLKDFLAIDDYLISIWRKA